MQRQITHRNTQTIWLFDYPSFASMDEDPNRLVFLSERDWNMIMQATNDIEKWQTRVFLEANGDNYLTVDDEDMETWQGFVSDMRIRMGDFEMIEEVLQEISDRLLLLVNKECCPVPAQPGGGGSRGAATTQAPPNPFEDDGENYPEELFDDRAEYLTHKCNAAADIIANLRGDMLGLSGLTLSLTLGITGWVAVLITVLLTPIPFDDLAALAALLITTALSYGLLAELSSDLGDNYEDLLCILYSSPDAQAAKDNFRAAISEIIIAEFSDPSRTFLQNALDHMVTMDAMNKLFTDEPTQTQDADCSACGDDCDACGDGELEIWTDIGDQGTITSTTPGAGEIVYEISSGSYQGGTIDFYISPTADPGDQCNQLITIELLTGSITPAAPAGWRTWNALGELTYTGDVEPPTGYPICVSNVSIRSSTAFTIRVTAQW